MSLVSQDFDYKVDNEGSQGSCFRTTYPSEASSYGLGDRCLIQIPHTHNGFLNGQNSWLNLSMTISGLTGTNVSGNGLNVHLSHIGAYSAISQVNIISGSTGYVQEIRNFQQVMALLINSNTDRATNLPGSIVSGTSPITAGFAVLGQVLNIAGSAIAKQDFSLPLIGLLSGKMCPLAFINDNLTLEIIFTSDIRDIIYTSVGSATTEITGGNVVFTAEYDADVIIATDSTITKIRQASDISDGIMSWSDTQIHAVNNSVSISELNSAGQSIKQTLVGGVKPKQLLQVFHTGFGSARGCGDQWQCLVYWSTEWRLRLGSQEYPPRFIHTMAEAQLSLQDCFDSIAKTTYNSQSCLDTSLEGARQPAKTSAQTLTKTGCSGYNFSKFYNTADGVDTTGKQLITEVDLLAKGTAVNAINACTFKRFGVIYSISDSGEFSVSY